MIYGSVCSGIEAASVAWKPLGFKAAWFSEIEPFPCSVLQHHYPETPNLGDMTKIHESEVFRGTAIDLLVGGTPCQSFSVAGLRKGMDDPRGNLALVFLKILDLTRPRWVVWENVPGVLSSGEGRDFGSFLGGLGQLGYGFAYRVLDAQYFGVPQRRRRVFVVGYLGDWRPAAAVLFERQSLSGDSAPSRKTGERTPPAAPLGAHGGSGYRQDLDNETYVPTTHPALRARDSKGTPEDVEEPPFIAKPKVYENHPADSRITECKDDTGPTVTSRFGTGGGNVPLVTKAEPIILEDQGGSVMNVSTDGQVGTLRRETHGHEPIIAIRTAQTSANGHGVSEDKAHTLDGANGQAVAFNNRQDPCPSGDVTNPLGAKDNGLGIGLAMQVRRLTPRECERLQGFPDDYTLIPHRGKQAADGPRYKALGNSMAVPVMAFIGRQILAFNETRNNMTPRSTR